MRTKPSDRTPFTAEYLRSICTYDPETGVFTKHAKPRRNHTARMGWKNPAGYIVISVNADRFMAHRLAWLYMTGRWPTHDIDHINHQRDDNRWQNLRHVSHKDNCRLRKSGRTAANKHGLTGVTKTPGGYAAKLCLGTTFETPEAAHEVYEEARRWLLSKNIVALIP